MTHNEPPRPAPSHSAILDRADVLERYLVADRSVPHLRLNFIASLDGAATRDGVSGALGNADDHLVFGVLRMLSDVIVVGAGTVRSEGYGGIRLPAEDVAWRLKHGLAAQPPIAVVSSRLDLSPEHALFSDAVVRPIVITHAGSPTEKRAALAAVADVLVCGVDAVDPLLMRQALVERGLRQQLCEGGPALFGALIEADAVDELCLTLSPVLDAGPAGRISASPVTTPRPMRLGHALPAGDFLFLRYLRA
jgi:riboflavin biosynthesis pyrimidine reductase